MIIDKFRLDGKTALVTGCKRGLGLAMAEGLAEAGADIIGVSSSLELDGGQAERAVRQAGRAFHPYQCDFSDRQALYRFIEKVKAERGPVDILVNNSGIAERSPITEHSDEQWDRVMEVNLNAQFILARELGRDMLERGSGKIIFMASVLTFQGGIKAPSYAATKGGVGQLTKAFANEWASRGVCVNAIAPGYFETDLTRDMLNDPERAPKIMDRIPAGAWGRPDQLKGAVVFLASEASDYVHGVVLSVDGGWMGR